MFPWSGDNGETGRRNRVGLISGNRWVCFGGPSSDASRLETRTEECHAQASLYVVKRRGAGKPIPRWLRPAISGDLQGGG